MKRFVRAAAVAAVLATAGCIAVPIPHWKERELGSSLEARDRHVYVVGFVSVWPEINTEYIVVLNHDPKLRTRVEYDPPGAGNSVAITEDAGPIHYRRVGGPKVDAALSPSGKKALIYDRAGGRMILFDVVEGRIARLEPVPADVRIWGVTWAPDETDVTYHVQVVENGKKPYPEKVTDTAYEARLEDGGWAARATGFETHDVPDPAASVAEPAAPAGREAAR